MKVAIIATDLDGTFLRDDHQFDHHRFHDQMDQMNAQGQHFVVASGNQLQHCIDVFDGINGELTYVAENGGPDDGEMVAMLEDYEDQGY
ncbi:hypothetical protein WP50_33450 [Lactiplantibacillus plantarum]|nr:hypothetical protein WP50_33450 [Lactiplantibacillus plantarum]